MKRHKKAVIALMAAGIAIAAVFIYALSCSPPCASAARRSYARDRQRRCSASGHLTRWQVCGLRAGDGRNQSLWLKQLATSDVPIVTLGEDQCPGLAFSPDGSYVYFVRKGHLKPNGDLYQVPLLGGTPRKLLAGIGGPPAFSPDGQRVAFLRYTAGEDSLLTALLDGSGERVLASYKAVRVRLRKPRGMVSGWQDPRLRSPSSAGGFDHRCGGRRSGAAGGGCTFCEHPGFRLAPGKPGPGCGRLSSGSFQLYEVPLKGGEARQITHDLSRYQGVRVSADGKTLLALQGQRLRTIQVATPGEHSEARTLSAGNQNRDGDNGVAWTADGKIVYSSVHNGHYDLWQMGADGSNPQRLTNNNDPYSGSYHPAISLRGGFIVLTRRTEMTSGTSGAWIWTVAT